MNKTYEVIYMSGVEGNSLYINDYRVAGPKPWGGGRIIWKGKLTAEDLKRAVPELRNDATAELLEALDNMLSMVVAYDFANGNVYNGLDEGQVISTQIIEKARAAIKKARK